MDKLAELSHGAKVVLGSAIAFLIISFFNWQEVNVGGFSAGISMWHGIGWIAGLLVIALIAWQAIRLANINLEIGVTPSMITTVLAVLLFVFTLITFLSHNEFRTWASWVGLILSIVIVVGAWMNMKAVGESLGDMRDKAKSMTSSSKDAPASAGPSTPGSTRDPADTAKDPMSDATHGDDNPRT